ncbi:MAG: hypothetical protein EVB06_02175 [Synechococcus sp. MED-G133]|uniref:hypothetical protein n=1 Tax=Synechococcus sp. A15-28 TaxID=1050638 RepID=UPI00121FA99B|nr:hypothetical protein [Synechococcus sp. A15-28]QNI41829.1 putative zn-ribbon protein [Synechococcus sp. A15-28]RZO08036.1 MAG: hypothetical protein EVB06_02175 [Synechococcus sp. MED-G133]
MARHAGEVCRGCEVTSVCQNCGSRRFRADRALAGRLICQSCGLAAGSRPSRSRRRQRRSIQTPQLARQPLIWILLLVGVAVAVVVLTS